MKARLQAVSTLLLMALVLSLVPAAALPSSAAAAQTCTDRAQFIADVTVPDGTRFDPGAAFTKTWRLRNIGTCTWTTAYTMVFITGEPMGSTNSVPMPSSVAPGQNVDVSVNLTAPNVAGNYTGYWRFKNANGKIFGIGLYADKSWWVAINVRSSSQGGVAYDFAANAEKATWSSGAGGLSFPGTNGDVKGFALRTDRPSFEGGLTVAQPGLLFSPQQITNGFIQAVYPDFAVQNGDRFKATVGCELNATSCYVAYRLDYQIGSTIRTFWSFRERYEGWTYNANLDLSPLAGQNVKFILYVSAYGSPAGDRALWGSPVIERRGITPMTPSPTVTGTPPTPTPTNTPGTVTVTVPPSSCDRVQFVSDVTVPDGTLMAPGQRFTKTWSLKNVGSCPWTTAYQLVYFSGDPMGGPASLLFSQNVAVGQTFRFSVDLTAPSAAGSYRGYWMFKNANGALFGIGAQGNKPWWVDIKVSGPTVTPGGPTFTPTPTSASVTPTAGTAYDFASNACAGTWYSGAGQLPCPGTNGDPKGFVLKVTNPKLETGATDTRPGLLTFPQNIQNGYIQGFFPPFRVQSGDRFRSIINCEGGARTCYVAFRVDYQTGTEPIKTLWGPFLERYEGQFYSIDVDLTPLAGKDVKFILTVLSAGVATGDRALWVAPLIYRAVGITPAPGTATPTATGTISATGTPTPTSTSGATATPTSTGASSSPTPTSTNTAGPTPTPTATTGTGANLYQNVKYNFKFTLPAGASIASQSDNVGRVTLPIVKPGTNLREKYIQIYVEENKNPCASSPAVDGAPSSTENVTYNNIPFVKTTGQGAALGNRYDWTSFATTNNNACISLAFILHSTNPGNYATPPPVFDPNAETAVIGTTMATYNKNQ